MAAAALAVIVTVDSKVVVAVAVRVAMVRCDAIRAVSPGDYW